jgi:chromatin remodeling complex protein RSC6
MYLIYNMSTIENNDIVNVECPIEGQFSSVITNLSQFKIQVTILTNQLKGLEKMVKKEIKSHKKDVIKKQQKGNRKPSGFAAATPISRELCDFMGKDHGSQIARTEVTKFICSYIKSNELTKSDNNRVIKPDNKLHHLLGTDDKTQITYFNIQRFMNKHFIKNKDNTLTNNIIENKV